MTPTPPAPRRAVVFALTFLVATTAFAVDASLPALPALSADMNSPMALTQRTVGFYLLGYALGQIPVGLAADIFGRRPVLLIGMSLFVVLGLLSAAASTIEALLGIRFGQGLAAATGVTLARTVARDITTGVGTARIMAHLSSAFGLAMICAPVIGSLFLMGFGWRGSFGASALWGGIGLALCYFYLAETRPGAEGARSAAPTGGAGANLRRALTAFLAERNALLGTLLAGLSFCAIICFVTFSSDILIRAQGLSPLGFALCFSIAALGNMLGGIGLRLVTGTIPEGQILRGLAFLFLVTAVALYVGRGAGLGAGMALFFVVLALAGAGMGLSIAIALKPLGHVAGIAAGILGSCQILIGAGFSSVATGLGIETLPNFMTLMAAICLVISCACCLPRSNPPQI